MKSGNLFQFFFPTQPRFLISLYVFSLQFNIDYRLSPTGSHSWGRQRSFEGRSASSDTESMFSSHSEYMSSSSISNRLVSSGTSFEA